MTRFLKTLSHLFLLAGIILGLTTCESADKQESETATTTSTELKDLPPAVADPAQNARVMDDFETRGLDQHGLPIELALPAGVVVKYDRELNGWLLFNEDESFKLVAVGDQTASEDIAQYWRNNPEDYHFRKMLIETPNGIMFEAERNGQVEYHVDYSIRSPEFLRIYSAKDKPFSQYQAEKMFHACRTIQGKSETPR